MAVPAGICRCGGPAYRRCEHGASWLECGSCGSPVSVASSPTEEQPGRANSPLSLREELRGPAAPMGASR